MTSEKNFNGRMMSISSLRKFIATKRLNNIIINKPNNVKTSHILLSKI